MNKLRDIHLIIKEIFVIYVIHCIEFVLRNVGFKRGSCK